MGENAAALILELGKALSNDQQTADSKEKAIYFDIVGVYMVSAMAALYSSSQSRMSPLFMPPPF
jgi:hypothetical protein